MRVCATALVISVLLAIAAPAFAQDAPAAGSASALAVSSIAVCTAVENRECVGAAESFPANVGSLSCLTRIEGGDGTTVTHVWRLDGVDKRRVELAVRSASWRTWSLKNVTPGTWTVAVLDAAGSEIASASVVVGP